VKTYKFFSETGPIDAPVLVKSILSITTFILSWCMHIQDNTITNVLTVSYNTSYH